MAGRGALLNYTTSIAVERTIGEIQAMLARAGAKSILTEYSEGETTAISFLIATRFGDRGFKLPANVEAVERVLWRQYERGKVQRRFTSRDQAARVAWRIIKDWLEAQLAIIETEMVSFEQVMLPYLTEGGRTLYELMERRHLALPPGKESAD